ncbi:MAG: hypothetical protein QNJ73_00550 [Gammaproteobacteria bacterium]|nr:hypothetical protein [Gammaproteobacteria bacterium]
MRDPARQAVLALTLSANLLLVSACGGEEELLNVLTIQQRVIGTQSSLSTAQRLLLEQRVNLNLALGGSWQD